MSLNVRMVPEGWNEPNPSNLTKYQLQLDNKKPAEISTRLAAGV